MMALKNLLTCQYGDDLITVAALFFIYNNVLQRQTMLKPIQ